MKFKKLIILSTSVLLSAALLPAVYAQDDGPGFDRPFDGGDFRLPHGGRGEGMHRPGPGRRMPGRPGGNPQELLDHLDSNGDGYIDESEFTDPRLTRVDEAFDRRDIDGDGLLSEEEAAPPRRRGDRPEPSETEREAVIACVRETYADWEGPFGVEDRFALVDTSGDGYIDLSEMSTALETRALALFDRIDADDDGLISLDELVASQEAQMNLRRVIRACVDEVVDPFEPAI